MNAFGAVRIIWALVMLERIQSGATDMELSPPCSSEIYCHGRLLRTVQMAKVYGDSKTFVDMKIKGTPNQTLHNFDEFMKACNNVPIKSQVVEFIHANFEDAGQEFDEWLPMDWVDSPKFLGSVRDPQFQEWGLEINQIWKQLGRQMKPEVKENQEQYSIIWIPNPVIVPGGRFREFYYWDSYWIIQGLLLSEMYHTAKGMLDNFLYVAKTYGHIPNGGRIYYLARSHPPLLIPAVKLYLDTVKDYTYIENNIETLEKEFDYWLTNHIKVVSHRGRHYRFAVYGDNSTGPRPESYREDVDLANSIGSEEERERLYSELKAATESGWDFSSRWFIHNGTNKGNLTNTKTRSIIPIDLNSIIYWNAAILSEFYHLLNDLKKAQKYADIASEWMEAVTDLLWHEELGTWLDFDLINNIGRDYFSLANIAPLWTGCYPKEHTEKIIRLVLKYLQTQNIIYPGGIPTTKEHTGEQWDFPNAWAPLQSILVTGLYKTDDEGAQRLAFELAQSWLRSNFKSFKKTHTMFEKYNATVAGISGGGGEYDTQWGFGWTNGVALDFLDKFGKTVTVSNFDDLLNETDIRSTAKRTHSDLGNIATGLLAIMVLCAATFIGISMYKRRAQIINEAIKRKQLARSKYMEMQNISKSS